MLTLTTRLTTKALPVATLALAAIAASPAANACQCMCANDIPDCVESGESLWDCVGDFIAYGCGGSSDCCWSVGSPQLTFDEQDQSSGEAKPICYLKYKLDRAFIKSWSISGDADGDPIPLDSFSINFTKIEYTPTVVGYDAAGNPIVQNVPETTPVPFEYDPETGKGVLKLEFDEDVDTSSPKLIEAICDGVAFPATTYTFVFLPACDGDMNGDGLIDAKDLNIVLAAFGESEDGDMDGDGDTDTADLNAVLSEFGTKCY